MDEWHNFLKSINASYRRAGSLEQELATISDQDINCPHAQALMKELTRTIAEILSREAFLEECHRERVPNMKRHIGTA